MEKQIDLEKYFESATRYIVGGSNFRFEHWYNGNGRLIYKMYFNITGLDSINLGHLETAVNRIGFDLYKWHYYGLSNVCDLYFMEAHHGQSKIQ